MLFYEMYHRGMHRHVWVDICPGVSVDMCVDMHVQRHMSKHAYAYAHRNVSIPVHSHVHRHVHRYVYVRMCVLTRGCIDRLDICADMCTGSPIFVPSPTLFQTFLAQYGYFPPIFIFKFLF